jgi:hypothetical protein
MIIPKTMPAGIATAEIRSVFRTPLIRISRLFQIAI